MALRTIKFRGKRFDTGEWVVGDLYTHDSIQIIVHGEYRQDDYFPIDPKTVGQFTGLYDSKGVEIYEGDVCRLDCNPLWNQIMCVGWHKETAHFGFRIRGESYIGCNDAFSDWIREKRITVIGNIYDNPDWEERK